MEKKKLMDRAKVFTNNVTRVPVVLLLDVSASMARAYGGTPTGRTFWDDGIYWETVTGGTCVMTELKKGVAQFYREIGADPLAKKAADVATITYSSGVNCVSEFQNLAQGGPVDPLAGVTAGGDTHLGEALEAALQKIDRQKEYYKRHGFPYYQPWLIVMTDGVPNGDAEVLKKSIAEIRSRVDNKKLTVFPIGIGKDADMAVLSEMSPKIGAVKMQDMKFLEMFTWLSQSVSASGRASSMELSSAAGWATL